MPSVKNQLKSCDFKYQSGKRAPHGSVDLLNSKKLTKKDSKIIKKFLKLKKFKNEQK